MCVLLKYLNNIYYSLILVIIYLLIIINCVLCEPGQIQKAIASFSGPTVWTSRMEGVSVIAKQVTSPIYIKNGYILGLKTSHSNFPHVFQGADRSYVTGPPFEQTENVDDRVMFFPQQQQQYNIV